MVDISNMVSRYFGLITHTNSEEPLIISRNVTATMSFRYRTWIQCCTNSKTRKEVTEFESVVCHFHSHKKGETNMKKMMISSFMTFCFLFIILSPSFAGEINLTLDKKTDYSRQDFGTGTYTAFTMIWAGDVKYLGSKIGDFTGSVTKTTYTSTAWSMNYEIIIPTGAPIADSVSVRTTHITTGSGSDKGIIYAATPNFKSFVGSNVTITGDTMIITF